MYTTKKNGLLMKHILHHSRTKCYTKKINFVWSIGNFWNICNFMDTLTSSNVKEESYKIDMCINREDSKLYFFINSTVPNPKEQININRYKIYIQGTTEALLCTNWQRFHDFNEPLYEVCSKTVRLNETDYLPNNTLSVHFTFESYTNIVHFNMYENIIDMYQSINARNNFVSDESDSIVTFLVEGKRFHVNKSLACATSPVFNKMLKNCTKDAEEEAKQEIEINDIKSDIFQLIVFYIEKGNLFDIDFDIDKILKQNIWLHLLAAAHRFDISDLKVKCEKYLIEFITKEDAIIFLDTAINNNALYLTNYIKKFIKLHMDDLRCTTKFLEKIQISPEILDDINNQKLSEENALYIKYNN
ncbi:Speckle-type POZ protein [Trachymyrmex septentrionalis]|uniref:Speckle-type POZ protein n=1 Tax=Trachymyrmex septentrionalis TaxID=34720 RepID=A0A195EUM4_9HYME|nr:Speckle-type POZ protein [Trachymyrmex septentrionalis]